MPHFAAFFVLRPAGRECPFFSFRALTAVGCRGLGGGGDARSLTPRCSVTPVSCVRWRLSTETFVIHLVRTTTTTTTTSVAILAQVGDNRAGFPQLGWCVVSHFSRVETLPCVVHRFRSVLFRDDVRRGPRPIRAHVGLAESSWACRWVCGGAVVACSHGWW